MKRRLGPVRLDQDAMFECGRRGFSVTQSADFMCINRRTFATKVKMDQSLIDAYRHGKAVYAASRMGVIDHLAYCWADVNDEKDLEKKAKIILGYMQLVPLKERATFMKMQHPPVNDTMERLLDDDGADDDDGMGPQTFKTWAEMAISAENWERKLDEGELKVDPVTGRRAAKNRHDRPHSSIQD